MQGYHIVTFIIGLRELLSEETNITHFGTCRKMNDIFDCSLPLLFNMSTILKLTIVKMVHTFIWTFFNIVIFYSLYAVIIDKIDQWVWISLGLILMEGLILMAFGKKCPITLIARRYSDSTKDNFDIFLPNWLAKHTQIIYTIIVFITILILAFRLIS